MTQTSGFNDPGSYDVATYAAAMDRMVGTGYQAGYLNELNVYQHTAPDMSVNVATGGAWVEGIWYKNGAVVNLAIAAAHATLHRYDMICVRRTATTGTALHVLKGDDASSPVLPTLTTDIATTYDLPIAYVYVAATTTAITTAMIQDLRDTVSCLPCQAPLGDFLIASGGNLDAGSHRITSVTDPSGDQDADTKAARNAAILTAVNTMSASAANVYGDSSDGAITISADTGGYTGLKQCTTFTVNSGKTLTLTGNCIIKATTSISIVGAINGAGAIAGGGGGGAGYGASSTGMTTGGASGGIGHIVAGTVGADGGSGTGSGNGAAGGAAGSAKVTAAAAGTLMPDNLVFRILNNEVGGSSGGGGGGGAGAYTGGISYWGTAGGAGGTGGACLILMAPSISVAGSITLSGANGSTASNPDNAYAGKGGTGGNGKGGICVIAGRTITYSGSFTSNNSGALYTVVI